MMGYMLCCTLHSYRYLQAQVFANYADYFSCFMRLQPLVYVGPLAARLPDQPLVSVSAAQHSHHTQ